MSRCNMAAWVVAVALTPLGAAPISQAHYQGQARLISTPQTCSLSLGVDEMGNLGSVESFGCQGVSSQIGSFEYEAPHIQLPAGARVLSVESHLWGNYQVDVLSYTRSVEPGDPTKPYRGWEFGVDVTGLYAYPSTLGGVFTAGYDLASRGWFDWIDTGYAGEVSWALEQGLPLPAPSGVGIMATAYYNEPDGSYSDHPYNSTTSVTDTYGLSNYAALWDLRITYEAPVPEPATAPLFLVGAAAGFVLTRRARSTHQS